MGEKKRGHGRIKCTRSSSLFPNRNEGILVSVYVEVYRCINVLIYLMMYLHFFPHYCVNCEQMDLIDLIILISWLRWRNVRLIRRWLSSRLFQFVFYFNFKRSAISKCDIHISLTKNTPTKGNEKAWKKNFISVTIVIWSLPGWWWYW